MSSYNRAMAEAPDGDSWVETALARLSHAGHRRGGARQEVLELIARQSCALSALEMEQALAAGHRQVSRASIYRILEELEQIGMVQRLDIARGITRYEPVRQGGHHHHHMVCDHCGRLQPFSDERLEREIKRLSEAVPLAVSEHEVILHGSCEECRA